jgi:hypothetical protein
VHINKDKQINKGKMKNYTIPRGYRLKISTHRLIKKIQEELNSSQDKIISRAVREYYASRKNANNKKQ